MRPAVGFAFQIISTTVIFLASTATCVETTVDLTYTKYVGTELGNGVSQWLGLRYAAPPVGALRFAPPQDPPVYAEPQPANNVRPHELDNMKAPDNSLGR